MVVPVTLTVTVQDAPAAKLTPLRLIEVEPAVAVAVPPQVFAKPFGLAITNPDCVPPYVRSSVKLTLVNVVAILGLLMVNVNAVESPVKIGFAVNALLITGGAITVSEEVP